jgi:hypothetical protein
VAGTRALPDLVSRIRVDSSGVDAAMMSLIHSFGKADLALAGVAAGIGLLVVGGKSMIDISEKYTRAENDLTQAINSRNAAHGKTIPALDLVSKASTSLAKATRQLAEFDAAHTGHIVTKTTAVKSLASQTAALDSANRRLAEFDVQYGGKKLTQLQEMRRQDLEGAIAAAHGRLAGADRGGVTTSRQVGGTLTEAQLMHREDLLKKVAAAHKAVSDAQHGGAKQTLIDGPALQSNLDDFIKTNRRYISDQSEVVNGYATLTRAGLSANEVQLDMNRALDIATLKHISLSDAVSLVNNAEHGRLRGLIDLGITTGQYVDSQGNLIKGSKDVGRAMNELDQKTADGRKTLLETQQTANRLGNDWQDLAHRGGPVIEGALDAVLLKAEDLYNWFDAIGQDDHLWATISARLVDMAKWIHDYIIKPIEDAYALVNGGPNSRQGAANNAASSAGRYGYGGAGNFATSDPNYTGKKPKPLAAGGPVVPGSVYTVGEYGPESLHMNPDGSGGFVVPDGGASAGGGGRGGGGNISVTLNGATMNPWDVAREIQWLKKTRQL